MKMKSFFSEVLADRDEAIAKMDREKFTPIIRNHLVQLFRKAHEVEPRLTGVTVGMGRATAKGVYTITDTEGSTRVGDPRDQDARDFGYMGGLPVHNEVLDFLRAVEDYSNCLCGGFGGLCDGLGYINDITLDDLVTNSSTKAKMWRKRST